MTNEVIQNILTRRSVRAFQERPVEREKIDAILQCAVHAPSAMNRQTWHFSAVLNPEKIKWISARLLAGGTVSLYSDWPVAGTPPECVRITADSTCDIRVSLWPEEDDALHLIPAVAVLGVGCRKGTACAEIERALGAFLAAGRVHRQAICKVCSIDLKKAEPGLTAFCAKHSLPFETYSAQQLAAVGGVFSASAFVQCVTGVDNVCERAAVCGSGGALYLKKFAGGGVTLAMALMPFAPDWRWQNG